jgi:inhibitor of cysteine peptidase
MVEIHENDAGREFVLARSEVFNISLPENPTTGFRWHLNPDPKCVLVEDRFDPGGSAPGCGGTRFWRFQVTETGCAELEFVCRRSWEQSTSGARRFAVTLNIRA